MRELYLIEEESTPTFHVLRDEDGVRYQLARQAFTHLEDPGYRENAEEAEKAEKAEKAEEAENAETQAEPEKHGESELDPTYQEMARKRSLPEPDPLFSTPLSMRPNEIQARIRAGSSPQELADEMGVAVSRLDPYAHPVLLERAQVAEAAKQSHPVRDGGPAKLSLFEILATAFAARGHSVSDATWDATREAGDDWVVHLRWKAGLSENEALWSFKRTMGSAPTTEARNPVAADLTDPDFVQPVRSLTAVDSGEPESAADDTLDDVTAGAGEIEGDFLQHPSPENQPQKRTRRAVTPHWEDVLLGVRTNTKRPRR